MSSFNTPTPSQPNHLPPFRLMEIPPKQKYRSMEDIMKSAKRVALPPHSQPHHLPNSRRPQVPPREKYRSMEDIMKRAKLAQVPRDDYSLVTCKICGSGENEEEMLLCDGCDNGFHMTCLRPVVVGVPSESWFCDGCQDNHPTPTQKCTQSEVRNNFFGITKSAMKYISPEVARRPSKRSRKKWSKLLPYIPSDDIERRNKQMDSLLSALKHKNLEFSDELTYFPDVMAPRVANQSKLEGDIQVLSKENTLIVEKCKAMYKRKKCPPLRVVCDPQEGYTVEADGPIKPMTFITEYTGDVDYVRNRKNDDCDSLMTLLIFNDESYDGLVICPDKRGNIARFISGINNHSEVGKKKKNLKSVRYSVNGECHVYLITIRDIAEGERLYYDYNEQENAYPTDHFI